jgi:hypothetical protein
MIEAALCVKVSPRALDPSSNTPRRRTLPGKTADNHAFAPAGTLRLPAKHGTRAPPQLP